MEIVNEDFIPIVLGLISTAIGLYFIWKQKKISESGISTEGIIYDFEAEYSTSTNSGSLTPVVRFLTEDKTWITEKTSIGTFPGLFKKGEAINIIYLPEDPKTFFIKDKRSRWGIYFFVFIGIIFIVAGILKMVKPDWF